MKHEKIVSKRTPLLVAINTLIVVLLTFIYFGCQGQAKTPESKTEQTQYFDMDSVPRKAVVVPEKTWGGTHPYYEFYDEAGQIVKRLKADEFPIRNPVFKLDFPQTTSEERKRGHFFEPLTELDDKGKLKTKVNIAHKKEQLLSLKKYGIVVRNPETADDILPMSGNTDVFVTIPACKYLIKSEGATVLHYDQPEQENAGNALMDCTWLSIYDHTGVLFKEVLLPGYIAEWLAVSDDGKFVFCSYDYTVIWDEGLSLISAGCAVIETETNLVHTLNVPKNETISSDIFFSEGLFQLTLNNSIRVYIDPYTRKVYKKRYSKEEVDGKEIYGKPFSGFRGVADDLTKFQVFSY